jgi:hypothetical protein
VRTPPGDGLARGEQTATAATTQPGNVATGGAVAVAPPTKKGDASGAGASGGMGDAAALRRLVADLSGSLPKEGDTGGVVSEVEVDGERLMYVHEWEPPEAASASTRSANKPRRGGGGGDRSSDRQRGPSVRSFDAASLFGDVAALLAKEQRGEDAGDDGDAVAARKTVATGKAASNSTAPAHSVVDAGTGAAPASLLPAAVSISPAASAVGETGPAQQPLPRKRSVRFAEGGGEVKEYTPQVHERWPIEYAPDAPLANSLTGGEAARRPPAAAVVGPAFSGQVVERRPPAPAVMLPFSGVPPSDARAPTGAPGGAASGEPRRVSQFMRGKRG